MNKEIPKISKRTIWKRSELDILFEAFSEDRYLTEARAINLAEKLNRSVRVVKTWFRNKRRKSSGCENSTSRDNSLIAEIINDLEDLPATTATTLLPYISLPTPYYTCMYDFARFRHPIYPLDLYSQPVDYTIGQTL